MNQGMMLRNLYGLTKADEKIPFQVNNKIVGIVNDIDDEMIRIRLFNNSMGIERDESGRVVSLYISDQEQEDIMVR